MLISDLVVVPCGPSSLDLNAASKTVAKVRDVRRIDNGVSRCKIALIPTRVDLATEEGEQIRDELAELGEPVGALAELRHRVRAGLPPPDSPSPRCPPTRRLPRTSSAVSHFLLRQVLLPRTAAPAAD